MNQSSNNVTDEFFDDDLDDKPVVVMTLDQIKAVRAKALDDLIDHAGSGSHLAKMLNVHYATIQGWVQRKAISKKGAAIVSEHPSLGELFTVERLLGDG